MSHVNTVLAQESTQSFNIWSPTTFIKAVKINNSCECFMYEKFELTCLIFLQWQSIGVHESSIVSNRKLPRINTDLRIYPKTHMCEYFNQKRALHTEWSNTHICYNTRRINNIMRIFCQAPMRAISPMTCLFRSSLPQMMDFTVTFGKIAGQWPMYRVIDVGP